MAEARIQLDMLVNMYRSEKSVWKVCDLIGLKSLSSVYRRLKKAGVITPAKRQPKVWCDGIPYARDKAGYMKATTRAGRLDSKTQRLHRLIASKTQDVEFKDVHHENGIKSDDSPENLKAMDRKDHVRLHKIKQDGHVFS